MGIPQGSVIAPILFNILTHDLPIPKSKNVFLAQYADDLCLWMNVTLKKSTQSRSVNYIRKIYQNELNTLHHYLTLNGLCLSAEKTNLVLFNAGNNPQQLPVFTIDNKILMYKDSVKFLGVILTSKLSWNRHLDYISTKARKSINLLKVICRQPLGMDTKSLMHIALSLIRSKLCYGQEAFFTAPKDQLKKLQSIDCKALKIALGVPIHTSCAKTYKEAGVLPLEEFRKLSCAKYILRCSIVNSNNKDEIQLRSDIDFPKRAKSISSQVTIATYTADLFLDSAVKPLEVSKKPPATPIPKWKMEPPFFDSYYKNLENKANKANANIIAVKVKQHLSEEYQNHLKVFTDGSVLENKNAGAAFVIPSLNVEKQYYLGKNYSIFTSELIAIQMALSYLIDLPITLLQIVLCVDSQSVISALKSSKHTVRPELILEIQHLAHSLAVKGTNVHFCWVPSHCGIFGNEWVDRAAKQGAKNSKYAKQLNIPISIFESVSLLERTSWKTWTANTNMSSDHATILSHLHCSRAVSGLIFRLRLNALRTKFVKNIQCICGSPINICHILLNCQQIRSFLPQSFTLKRYSEDNLHHALTDLRTVTSIAESLLKCPLSRYL